MSAAESKQKLKQLTRRAPRVPRRLESWMTDKEPDDNIAMFAHVQKHGKDFRVFSMWVGEGDASIKYQRQIRDNKCFREDGYADVIPENVIVYEAFNSNKKFAEDGYEYYEDLFPCSGNGSGNGNGNVDDYKNKNNHKGINQNIQPRDEHRVDSPLHSPLLQPEKKEDINLKLKLFSQDMKSLVELAEKEELQPTVIIMKPPREWVAWWTSLASMDEIREVKQLMCKIRVHIYGSFNIRCILYDAYAHIDPEWRTRSKEVQLEIKRRAHRWLESWFHSFGTVHWYDNFTALTLALGGKSQQTNLSMADADGSRIYELAKRSTKKIHQAWLRAMPYWNRFCQQDAHDDCLKRLKKYGHEKMWPLIMSNEQAVDESSMYREYQFGNIIPDEKERADFGRDLKAYKQIGAALSFQFVLADIGMILLAGFETPEAPAAPAAPAVSETPEGLKSREAREAQERKSEEDKEEDKEENKSQNETKKTTEPIARRHRHQRHQITEITGRQVKGSLKILDNGYTSFGPPEKTDGKSNFYYYVDVDRKKLVEEIASLFEINAETLETPTTSMTSIMSATSTSSTTYPPIQTNASFSKPLSPPCIAIRAPPPQSPESSDSPESPESHKNLSNEHSCSWRFSLGIGMTLMASLFVGYMLSRK